MIIQVKCFVFLELSGLKEKEPILDSCIKETSRILVGYG